VRPASVQKILARLRSVRTLMVQRSHGGLQRGNNADVDCKRGLQRDRPLDQTIERPEWSSFVSWPTTNSPSSES